MKMSYRALIYLAVLVIFASPSANAADSERIKHWLDPSTPTHVAIATDLTLLLSDIAHHSTTLAETGEKIAYDCLTSSMVSLEDVYSQALAIDYTPVLVAVTAASTLILGCYYLLGKEPVILADRRLDGRAAMRAWQRERREIQAEHQRREDAFVRRQTHRHNQPPRPQILSRRAR